MKACSTTLIVVDPDEFAEVLTRMILRRAPHQIGHFLQSATALGHGRVLLSSHDDYVTATPSSEWLLLALPGPKSLVRFSGVMPTFIERSEGEGLTDC